MNGEKNMSRKRVRFSYDSGNGEILMNFHNNVVITNADQIAVAGPRIRVTGYAPDGIPIIAAKECLEEMLAIVNAAMGTE